MVQLWLPPLLCLLSSTLSDEPQALFPEDCCTKKMVGGVGYTQIAGNTEGVDCSEQCVYEEDGNPGSPICFKSGGPAQLPTECTESYIDSAYVSFSRSSGILTFKTEIGTYSCIVGSASTEGENIECSKQEEQEGGSTSGTEKAAFFFSKSPDDEFEWMCFHTTDVGIHCDFNETLACHFVLPKNSEPATLFVECAQNVTGNTNDSLKSACKELCDKNSSCTFWTLSITSDANKPTEDTHGRFHQGFSECGIRTYDPVVLLKNINQDQTTAKKGQPIIQALPGSVYVFDKKSESTPADCLAYCNSQYQCTTWTWQRQPDGYGSVCALNTYKPRRRIVIPQIVGPPQLVSGCIPSRLPGIDCATLPKTC